jgi:antirestriction protein ArdC
MRVLRHDATLLVHAAAQAQRAADYIQNLSPATDASLERSSLPHR